MYLNNQSTLGNMDFQDFDFLFNIDNKINIMPILSGAHYTLIVCDLKKMTFAFLDPLIDPSVSFQKDKTKLMFQKLSSFIDIFNKYIPQKIYIRNLKIVEVPHVKQSDNYNCGIFVLYFIECFLKGKPLNVEFYTASYRDEIKEFLLETSRDMRNYCLQCGRLANDGDVSQCKRCGRKIHSRHFKDLSGYYFNNICPLCQ